MQPEDWIHHAKRAWGEDVNVTFHEGDPVRIRDDDLGLQCLNQPSDIALIWCVYG